MATILVVEDDILLSLDTSEALEDAGYDVIAAVSYTHLTLPTICSV